MKKEIKYKIILVLMALALIASVILSFVPLEQACGGTSNNCVIVQTSQYEFTLGLKNSHIGLVAFPILALLVFFELNRPKKYQKLAITIGMLIGSFFALYFLYLQFFVLKAICKYCMVVDIAVLASLVLIIFWDEK